MLIAQFFAHIAQSTLNTQLPFEIPVKRSCFILLHTISHSYNISNSNLQAHMVVTLRSNQVFLLFQTNSCIHYITMDGVQPVDGLNGRTRGSLGSGYRREKTSQQSRYVFIRQVSHATLRHKRATWRAD